MASHDPRIDAYLERAEEFAQPVLEHLRAIVHATCPNVEETIKWGFPHFMHAGSILCSMAAFKQHVAFGFWKGKLIDGIEPVDPDQSAMGQFGRLRRIDDLPGKRSLAGFIRQAMKLNEQGTRQPLSKRSTRSRAVSMPPELAAGLARSRRSREHFEKLPPGQQREYLEWIAEGKQVATRKRRSEQAIDWLSDGKPRNWRYMRKN